MRLRIPRSSGTKLSTQKITLDLLADGEDGENYRYGYMWEEGGLRPSPSPVSASFSFDGKDVLYRKYIKECGRLLYMLDGGIMFGITIPGFSKGILGAVTAGGGHAFTFQDSDGVKYFCMGSYNKYSRIGAEFTSSTRKIVTIPYNVGGGIMHCHRLFCYDMDDRYLLRWTGYDQVDWSSGISGSGYLSVNSEGGKILTVAELGDDILLLRERGITIVHAFGDPRNYRIAPEHNMIFTDDACEGGGTVGGKFYFAGTGGIYVFDGQKAEKLYALKSADVTYGTLHVSENGWLYDEVVADGKSCLLGYRLSDGANMLFGEDCEKPFYAESTLYCINNKMLYTLSDDVADVDAVWRSKPVTGGYDGLKTLKRIKFSADSSVCVKVISNLGERTFCGSGCYAVDWRDKEFTVEITGGGKVESLKVELEVSK